MKTEMAAKPKQKDRSDSKTPHHVAAAVADAKPAKSKRPIRSAKAANQPTAAERRLAGLKAREANLKAKLDRTKTFNPDTRDQSLERTKTHLEHIQAEIKKAS